MKWRVLIWLDKEMYIWNRKSESTDSLSLSLYRSPRSPKSECTESGWVNEAQITTRDKMSVAAVTCHTVALSVKRVYQLVKEINWIDIVSWSHTHYLFRTEANDGGKLFAYYYIQSIFTVCVCKIMENTVTPDAMMNEWSSSSEKKNSIVRMQIRAESKSHKYLYS